MGDQDISRLTDEQALRKFTFQLLRDVRALEHMLENDIIESGKRRIGAEQEVFLVDSSLNPASIAMETLSRTKDDHFTTELTRFNLEFNLDPKEFGGTCLSEMESEINLYLDKLSAVLRKLGAHPVLVGILPTIGLGDLSIDNLTPMERYHALNEIMQRLRGGPFEFQIRGADELLIKHDSVMLEGCNTSFQCHFQVSPSEFPAFYNISQVLAGPVMAASTNSPMLFGRRLWHETRIALFQQSIDTRRGHQYLREMSPRVNFGNDWVHDSVLEIYKDDIARFRILMTSEDIPDPFEAIEAGIPPKLRALQLHNGTVYRWNRACYGVYQGKPHLRIENRVLPAGPTPVDEVANAALWFGLVGALYNLYPDIRQVMRFDDARSNFFAAARLGLSAEFTWINQQTISAKELLLNELIPMAREGLEEAGIDGSDIDRYLGVVHERISAGQTGSHWLLNSYNSMEDATKAERLYSIMTTMIREQQSGKPVHEWPLAVPEESAMPELNFKRVEQYMTTDLVTVGEDELIDLVANMMIWRRIRHVVVEDHDHRLLGLVSHRNLLKYIVNNPERDIQAPVPVRDIMTKDPVFVTPETPTLEAIDIMKMHNFSALPVVRDGQLVGIVTEVDFMKIAGGLLERQLRSDTSIE